MTDAPVVHIRVADTLSIDLKERVKIAARSGPGDKGRDFQLIQGDELTKTTGRWAWKHRRIDWRGDWYRELVIDLERSLSEREIHILADVSEPLSDHQGHGSAKGKK